MKFVCGHCTGIIREVSKEKHLAAFVPHDVCGYETFFPTFIRTPKQPDPTPGEVRRFSIVSNAAAGATQDQFVRMLGKGPLRGAAFVAFAFDFETLVGTFGPPELRSSKSRGVAFWNFTRRDGSVAASVKATFRRGDSGHVLFNLVAPGKQRSFENWLLGQYSAVEHAEIPPQFVFAGCTPVIDHLN